MRGGEVLLLVVQFAVAAPSACLQVAGLHGVVAQGRPFLMVQRQREVAVLFSEVRPWNVAAACLLVAVCVVAPAQLLVVGQRGEALPEAAAVAVMEATCSYEEEELLHLQPLGSPVKTLLRDSEGALVCYSHTLRAILWRCRRSSVHHGWWYTTCANRSNIRVTYSW